MVVVGPGIDRQVTWAVHTQSDCPLKSFSKHFLYKQHSSRKHYVCNKAYRTFCTNDILDISFCAHLFTLIKLFVHSVLVTIVDWYKCSRCCLLNQLAQLIILTFTSHTTHIGRQVFTFKYCKINGLEENEKS